MTRSIVDIVWLHNDLRIADNPLLNFTSRPEQLLCVYVLDERWLEQAIPDQNVARIGPPRLRFLWESLMELRGELLQRGSDLLVRIGSPAEEVANLANHFAARAVRVSHQSGSEENNHISAIVPLLEGDTELELVENNRLFDRAQLPFGNDALPGSFSAFRRKVEKHCDVPSATQAPITLPLWPDAAPRGFPPLKQVCELSAGWNPDERKDMTWAGGEAAGHERLRAFIWEHNGPATYKQTRNGLLGDYFSTHLSPWLAHGCLSPRQIVQEVRAWEARNGSTESSYWIVFELLWREYFQLAAVLEQHRLFGPSGLPTPDAAFVAWQEGNTGVPFIDAAMIELASTGWMSNRARQNVASFLVKDLNVDWRLGATWFEHCLMDYDVASNWGNWRYVAGVGRDPRQDRYFNVLKQACQYDPNGEYVAHWLPDLATLPEGKARHQPWRAAPSHFSPPRVEPQAWQPWLIDQVAP
ncbi:DASH family cryptochrome [Vreelandella aquamarina]|uniref:DASH family cryptochrome n=1 Tax=Vreelandella aquamarina TaxID=77097 RepID=UPI00384FE62C